MGPINIFFISSSGDTCLLSPAAMKIEMKDRHVASYSPNVFLSPILLFLSSSLLFLFHKPKNTSSMKKLNEKNFILNFGLPITLFRCDTPKCPQKAGEMGPPLPSICASQCECASLRLHSCLPVLTYLDVVLPTLQPSFSSLIAFACYLA